MSALDLTEARQPLGDQLADLMERPASAPIADRYAAASDLTPDALLAIWRGIPVEKQKAIGVKLLGHYLAELVADDDGLISTEAERDAAAKQQQDDFQALFDAVQAALPQVLWFYPEDCLYEGDRVVLPDGRRYPENFSPILLRQAA